MIVGVAFLKMMWEAYSDLILLGKIVMFPIFFVCAIGMVLFGIVETVVIDSWVLMFALFSKETSVKDLFYFYWN